MARGKPNSKKVVERPKTRKELRKDKRLQKKANRVHFHKRKKELKIEYRERLKQQKKNAGKGPKRNRDDDDDDAEDDEEAVGDDDIYDQADMSSGDDDDDPNVRGTDDSDEEIESDFELSDEELEQKFAGRVKAKASPRQAQKAKKAQPSEHDRFTADLQKEKQKQRKLEKEMRKQRVKQLRAANEDEDKMIRKLEKQLKIDKKRSEKHVPTMFNDGLEYALELCLPENIQKMYTAAKEAAENEEDSDSGFQEDLAMAMGEAGGKSKKRKRDEAAEEEKQPEKSAPKRKARDVAEEAASVRSAHKMAKLRQVESKYFDTDDELDSDLSGNDSEFEHEGEESDDQVLEVHNQHKKKKQQKKASKDAESEFSDGSDFGLQDDENDFEDDESDSGDEEGDEEYSDEEESDDEGPEEVHKAKKSKPAAAKKAGGNKRTVEEDSEDSAEDDDDGDFDDDSESEVEEPRPGKTKGKQEKPVKKTVDPDSDDFGDGDDADEDGFDEDVFGLSSGDEADESPAAGKKNQPKSDVWEDIYGRTRDKDGNVITAKSTGDAPAAGAPTKYLPPHLRARAEAAAAAGNADATTTATNPLDDDPKRREKLLRLRKQLKGYINRLSEANMHRIATDIETVYMQNSRHDVNDTLTQLIEAALVSNVLAPERMVLEHMMLIAALHANVGSEVGAHFLQRFVERLDSQLSAIDTYDVEDKRLDNVLFVLCHMYTFKLFQHHLIYEILNRLTVTLSEKSVECILLALRSIGFALRKDDAIALKDLIAVLQRKAGEASEEFKNNPRLRYMLDVVLAIKNNNVNKIPSYDPALAEHLRKILRTMLVNGRYVTTLNITLDDLLRADSRGKWWVVGSAWTGNVSDIGGAQQQQQSAKQTAAFAEATQFSATILALAKKQRMNTDDRRNVFCILMTAEDYLDAFEKLHHLGIRDQKVIVTVLIHCCLSEKVYNPYYGVLAQKFCDFDRKYQLAVQFALWDRIREVATSASPLQVKNMAQFMGHLIEHGGLALSVLKVVEFGELDKVTLRLVRQVVLGLLMGTEAVCKQVFERIAPSGKLKAFKDSLRLFLHHFLMKGGAKSGVPEAKLDLLRARIRLADKALETADSKLQF